MAYANFYQQWQELPDPVQGWLLCLAPFQGTVNLGGPIFSNFIKLLLRRKSFQHLSEAQLGPALEQGKSLGWLRRLPAYPRTEMLQLAPHFSVLVKQEARQRLRPRTLATLERCYVRHYRWLALQLHDMFRYTPDDEREVNMAFMALERENLQQAVELAIRHRMYDFTVIWLVLNDQLDMLGAQRQRQHLAEGFLTKLEAMPEEAGKFRYQVAYVDLVDTCATALLRQFQFAEAEKQYRKAARLFRQFELDDKIPQAARTVYQSLAAVLAYRGKWAESNRFYEKMYAVVKRFKDAEGLADYYLNSGKNYLNLQEYEDAMACFAEAKKLYYQLRLPDWAAKAAGYQGLALVQQREFDPALPHYEEAIAVYTVLGNHQRLAEICNECSLLFLGKHEYEQAQAHAKQAVEHARSAGAEKQEGLAYLNLSSVSVANVAFEEAEEYLAMAFGIFKKIGDHADLELVLKTAALLDEATGSQLQVHFKSKISRLGWAKD